MESIFGQNILLRNELPYVLLKLLKLFFFFEFNKRRKKSYSKYPDHRYSKKKMYIKKPSYRI